MLEADQRKTEGAQGGRRNQRAAQGLPPVPDQLDHGH